MWIGRTQIVMRRGWIVKFKDGSVICEDDMPWSKVPNRGNIEKVILKYDDRFWSFDNKKAYTVPTKRGYIDVSGAGVSPQQIHSRTIGYYDIENKCKVILRVEEATGNPSFETIPIE